MERGANTFPFHNLLPYSESNEGLFLFFSPSLNWIKEKSVATLAIRNICDQTQNNPNSVLPPYYTIPQPGWFTYMANPKDYIYLKPDSLLKLGYNCLFITYYPTGFGPSKLQHKL